MIILLPYNTKFWREKLLANLGNYKQFTKCFLSKFYFLKAEVFDIINS